MLGKWDAVSHTRGLRPSQVKNDTPVGRLDLPVRIRNSLLNDGYKTFGAAKKIPHEQLLRIPNFGRKSLKEWVLFVRAVEGVQEEEEAAAEEYAGQRLGNILVRISALHKQLAGEYRKIAGIIDPKRAGEIL